MELHKKTSRADVVCVSLNLDYLGVAGSPPESHTAAALKFLRSRQATFDNVLATQDVDTMLVKLNLGAPPAVYVYNRQGELAKRFDNDSAESEEDAFTYEDVAKLVDQLVDQ